jgi:hypothetical protein
MNKKEAADYLGISTRALERYMSLQRISVRYEKGKTGDQAIFETSLRLSSRICNVVSFFGVPTTFQKGQGSAHWELAGPTRT